MQKKILYRPSISTLFRTVKLTFLKKWRDKIMCCSYFSWLSFETFIFLWFWIKIYIFSIFSSRWGLIYATKKYHISDGYPISDGALFPVYLIMIHFQQLILLFLWANSDKFHIFTHCLTWYHPLDISHMITWKSKIIKIQIF